MKIKSTSDNFSLVNLNYIFYKWLPRLAISQRPLAGLHVNLCGFCFIFLHLLLSVRVCDTWTEFKGPSIKLSGDKTTLKKETETNSSAKQRIYMSWSNSNSW